MLSRDFDCGRVEPISPEKAVLGPIARFLGKPRLRLPLLRDAINLHLDLIPQHRLHGRARGQHGDVFEEFPVSGVVAVEVFDVGEMHGAFDNVVECAAGGL